MKVSMGMVNTRFRTVVISGGECDEEDIQKASGESVMFYFLLLFFKELCIYFREKEREKERIQGGTEAEGEKF